MKVIMNDAVVLSEERSVRVYRRSFTESGKELLHEYTNSHPFLPGEELVVTVSSSSGGSTGSEFLFEAKGGAKFLGQGGCSHTRTDRSGQLLTMPKHRSEVQIWVGKCFTT